jgi:hypothetical protein
MDSDTSESEYDYANYQYMNPTWETGDTSPISGGYSSDGLDDDSFFNDALGLVAYEAHTLGLYGVGSLH